MTSTPPLPIVQFGFYAFLFSIPIETLDIGVAPGVGSLASLLGYLFIAVALLQPALTFGELPRPLLHFAAYLLVFVCVGILEILEIPGYSPVFVKRLLMIIQMLVLFWVSCNLFRDPQVVKGGLLAFSAGCVVLSLLQVGGIAATEVAQGRVSAMGQDANGLGSLLSLGLLALLGLAYGRNSQDGKIRWLAWIGFSSLSAGIVLSGSRGAFLSLIAGVMCLAARTGSITVRLKVGFLAIVAVCLLVWAAFENDAVRTRWERTYYEGNVSNRDKIMPAAWSMFIESPIIGWGPGNNILELGRRLGEETSDTHNGYLWVLTETGLAGAVPYFLMFWMCLRAAWRARHGPEGSLPLALLVCVFLVNMSITWHYRKILWIVLAYSVASESFLLERWRLAHPASAFEKTLRTVGHVLQRR